MRAVVMHTPGRPPEVGEHPEPEAGEGRTLVRVTAVPVVPLDLLCASGTSYFGAPQVPYVPGVQGVGVVEQSGSVPAGHPGVVRDHGRDGPGRRRMAELCVGAGRGRRARRVRARGRGGRGARDLGARGRGCA